MSMSITTLMAKTISHNLKKIMTLNLEEYI